MRRLALITATAVALLVVLAVGVAWAASIGGVTTRDAGSGSAVVGRCATSVSIQYQQSTTGGPVTGAVVGAIPGACAGGRVIVTTVNAASAATARGEAPVAGTTATVSFATPFPAAADVKAAHVLFVGP